MLGELNIPDGVHLDGDAIEFIRFWVCDNEEHVTLRIGSAPVEDEPEIWGSIIADICKHAANGLIQDNPEHGSVETVIARIETGFRTRLMETPSLRGQLQGITN